MACLWHCCVCVQMCVTERWWPLQVCEVGDVCVEVQLNSWKFPWVPWWPSWNNITQVSIFTQRQFRASDWFSSTYWTEFKRYLVTGLQYEPSQLMTQPKTSLLQVSVEIGDKRSPAVIHRDDLLRSHIFGSLPGQFIGHTRLVEIAYNKPVRRRSMDEPLRLLWHCWIRTATQLWPQSIHRHWLTKVVQFAKCSVIIARTKFAQWTRQHQAELCELARNVNE